MEKHTAWKQRLLSALLAVAICMTMLPVQGVARAEEVPEGAAGSAQDGAPLSTETMNSPDEPQPSGSPQPNENAAPRGQGNGQAADISVSWLPQQEAVPTGAVGTVQLRAQLQAQDISGATVRIQLDKQETAALQEFRGTDGKLTDGASLESNGVMLTLSLQDEKADISFFLDTEHPSLEYALTFQVPNGVSAPFRIAVGDDISVSSEDKANPVLSVQTQAMDMEAEYQNWAASLSATQQKLQPTGEGALPDFSFLLQASSPNTGAQGALYTQEQNLTLVLALPEGVTLPAGEIVCENGIIRIGGTPVAAWKGVPDQSADAVVSRTDDGLKIVISRAAQQPQEAELADITGASVEFYGAAFSVAPGFAGADIGFGGTLESTPVAGQPSVAQPFGTANVQLLPSQQGGSTAGGAEEEAVVSPKS